MTALLELRENLKKIYSRNEAFILPVIKFLLSFIVLSIINGKMGYMTKLDNMAIVLIVSLLCSFLPTGFMAFFAMMFAVLHMYALSIETAAFCSISARCEPRSMILPSCTTKITSALRMVESRCATIKDVLPCMTVSIACCSFCSVMVSTDDVASSNTKILGSARSARANDKSCFSPVDRLLPPSPTCVS